MKTKKRKGKGGKQTRVNSRSVARDEHLTLSVEEEGVVRSEDESLRRRPRRPGSLVAKNDGLLSSEVPPLLLKQLTVEASLVDRVNVFSESGEGFLRDGGCGENGGRTTTLASCHRGGLRGGRNECAGEGGDDALGVGEELRCLSVGSTGHEEERSGEHVAYEELHSAADDLGSGSRRRLAGSGGRGVDSDGEKAGRMVESRDALPSGGVSVSSIDLQVRKR
jgi:hypothetical protein